MSILNSAVMVVGQIPSFGLGFAKRIDLKKIQVVDIAVPANGRTLLDSIRLVTTEVDGLTAGATLNVRQYDAVLIQQREAASLTTNFAGDQNDLVFKAKSVGTTGNNITVALTAADSAGETLVVSVVGTAISVALATDGDKAIVSTAAQVQAAINEDAPAAALVEVKPKAGNDGTGIVTALSVTNLSGGTNPEEVQGIVESTDLADTDAVGGVQALTIATGTKVLHGGCIRLSITAGSLATKHFADLVVCGVII